MTQAEMLKNLENRWSWLVEDIEDDNERLSTQQILEKTYQEMVGKGLISKDALCDVFGESCHPEDIDQALQEVIEKYDGHYVEDFEEGYAENFEEERNVEIFKKEKKEQNNNALKITPLSLFKAQPMAVPSDHIYYIKPTYAKGKN